MFNALARITREEGVTTLWRVGDGASRPAAWTHVIFVDSLSGFNMLSGFSRSARVSSGVCPHHGPSGGGERSPAGLLLPVQTGAA